MTITLGDIGRNGACDGTVDKLDVGAGTAKMRVRAGSTTLVDINLPNPAFGDAGAAVVGRASANGLPLSGTGVAAGTADNYQALDRDGNVIWSGSAGAAGSGPGGANPDAVLDNPFIAIGQVVFLVTWQHNQPP